MELLQTILGHRTIRKYREQTIRLILEKFYLLGRAATTGNMQVYSIIVTKIKIIVNY